MKKILTNKWIIIELFIIIICLGYSSYIKIKEGITLKEIEKESSTGYNLSEEKANNLHSKKEKKMIKKNLPVEKFTLIENNENLEEKNDIINVGDRINYNIDTKYIVNNKI